MREPRLLVGTIGDGLWSSEGGEAWTREADVPADARIFSFAGGAGTVVAGGAGYVYRRADGGWRALALPDPALQAWSVAVDPKSPSTLFAGCRPLALLRSDDGGARWTVLDLRLPEGAERPHTPRVTAVLVEPDAAWCGVEVGGVFASGDGRRGWSPVSEGLPSLDVHALARGAGLLAATPRGVARRDGRWTATDLDAPWRYCRALAAVPGRPDEVLCGLGDGPPGSRGAVVRSEDGGRRWGSTLFPGTAASSVWSLAVSAAAPDLALAAAIGGELFLSEDAGRSWRRLARRFHETRAVHIA